MGFSKNPFWTPTIQDGWDPPSWKSTWRYFFCWGWSALDKISQTGAEWHVNCSDMVKIETRCRIPIRRTFERIPWHVIPEPCTCHIAGCNNFIHHIENRFSPYFCFYAIWALTSGGFRIVSDTLVPYYELSLLEYLNTFTAINQFLAILMVGGKIDLTIKL